MCQKSTLYQKKEKKSGKNSKYSSYHSGGLHSQGGVPIPPDEERHIPKIPTHDYSNVYGWNLDGGKMR